MTVTLFITIFTIGSAISGLLTEAIKKAYANAKKEYSANIIALVDAIVVGIGGCCAMYSLLGVDWTFNNILCAILMGCAVWIASMIGYDKVIQTIKEITAMKEIENESK